MKNKNKPKINFFLIIRYLYPTTIALIVVVLMLLLRFLYTHVYQTIIQAELITDLRREISDESLEKTKFEQIIANLKVKDNPNLTDLDKLKDPFLNLTNPEPPKK